MKRRLISLSFGSAFAVLAIAATCAAQDFQKAYRVSPGGQVKVNNISGDVVVTGYDGDSVIVTGIKKGRDRDLIEVEDRSGSNSVDVGVKYPKNCNCDASIRFEVQVPR